MPPTAPALHGAAASRKGRAIEETMGPLEGRMTNKGRIASTVFLVALAVACRSLPVRELSASPAPLPPGRYSLAAFRPAVTLDLGQGWTSVNRFDDFFDVQQDVGSPDVIAVQIARPRGFIGRSGVQPVRDPHEAREVLSGNLGLAVAAPRDLRIGGLEGQAFEIENRSGEHVGVLQLGPGTLGIDSGRKLWIAGVKTPEGLVSVMVGGSVAKWDAAMTAAQPVLASIQFPKLTRE
jgi:hypothetical protein